MLISLRSDHKEHLQLLTGQTDQVVGDFCKLAADFLQNGPNVKLYGTAASKLEVSLDAIQNCVYGLINLLLIASRHQVSEADFRDSVLTLGFSEDQQAILSKFYNSKISELNQLHNSELIEPHFHDLQWRFEAQLATRSLQHQATPLITLDLALKTKKDDGSKPDITHHLLQTDPTNLLHLTNELERALNEAESRHTHKIQRTLHNLQQ